MRIHSPFRTAILATLGVGVGILVINGTESLSTVLLYIGTALFLSLGLEPAIEWLERRSLPRWAAVVIAILALLLTFAGIVAIILPIIIGQLTQLVEQLTRFLNRPTVVREFEEWLTDLLPSLDTPRLVGEAQEWLLANLGSITSGVISAGVSIVQGLFGALIVLILTIYFTASTPALRRAVYGLVPASKRDRFIDISEQITDAVGHYVLGQLSLGVINGVLSFIFLSIIQAPFPIVLAVLAFLGSLIPLVGTITASALIVLVCLIPGLGSPATALAAGIYYLIYMQIEAYVISPRIMSRAVAVPGAVVVVAALAGGALLGLLGALIAIPVAASLLIIYRQVIIPQQNLR